jgi:hypothetical protein
MNLGKRKAATGLPVPVAAAAVPAVSGLPV